MKLLLPDVYSVSDSRGIVVLLPATLSGMGIVVDCDVLARRVKAGMGAFYSDCTIVGAPDDFPDGKYTIEFEGIHSPVAKSRGSWLVFETSGKNLENSGSISL